MKKNTLHRYCDDDDDDDCSCSSMHSACDESEFAAALVADSGAASEAADAGAEVGSSSTWKNNRRTRAENKGATADTKAPATAAMAAIMRTVPNDHALLVEDGPIPAELLPDDSVLESST